MDQHFEADKLTLIILVIIQVLKKLIAIIFLIQLFMFLEQMTANPKHKLIVTHEQKPNIKFSYGTPTAVHHSNSRSYSQHFRNDYHNPNRKQAISIKQPTFTTSEVQFTTKGSRVRKQIFAKQYSKAQTKSTQSNLEWRMERISKHNQNNSEKSRSKKKRKQIFGIHKNMEESVNILQPDLNLQKRQQKTYQIQVRQCQHPTQLINYVDIGAIRQNKASKWLINPVKSQIKKLDQQKQDKILSNIKIQFDQQQDSDLNVKPIGKYAQLSQNILTSDRFFDRQQNSNKCPRISYNQVSLFNTLVDVFPKEQLQTNNPNPFQFNKFLSNMINPDLNHTYILPTFLIVLGVFLFLIQISQ